MNNPVPFCYNDIYMSCIDVTELSTKHARRHVGRTFNMRKSGTSYVKVCPHTTYNVTQQFASMHTIVYNVTLL